MRKLFKTTLQAAIADLKAKGKISSAKDVLEHLDYKSKGTLSAYATGLTEISDEFKNKFENYYDVKLDDYADLITNNDDFLKVPHHGSREPEQVDYEKKYIALLEEHLATKKALEKELQEFRKQFSDFEKKVNLSLKEFQEFAVARMALLKTVLRSQTIHRAKVEKISLEELNDEIDIILVEETDHTLKGDR